ncbi:MAG: InlB B-repeat-containing protein [Gaiellaceae bacterium]
MSALPAAAAVPTFQSTFTCSALTPCGAFTSISPGRLATHEATGKVYVIDNANDVIDVFDSSGVYLSQITATDTTDRAFNFGAEADIAVDNSGGLDDGSVYVNSSSKSFAFDASGRFLWESTAGVSDACGIAVDNAGNPWLGDFSLGLQQLAPADGSAAGSPILAGSSICRFAFDGAGNIIGNHWSGYIEKFDAGGNSSFIFEPAFVNLDVAVDTANDTVYGLEGGGGLYAWDTGGTQLAGSPFGSGGTMGLTVNATSRKLYLGTSTGVDLYSVPAVYNATVTPGGSGTGTVDADVGVISDCSASGGTCTDKPYDGTQITLRATPTNGSSIGGWTGCDSNPDVDRCVVTVNGADVNVTVNFVARHVLRVVKDGTGSGTVTGPSVSCGLTCTASYDDGQTVVLRATPNGTSTFAGWRGCDSNPTPDRCQVTMDADKTVTATFNQKSPTPVTGAGTGATQTSVTLQGTVNPNGATVTDCHFEYGASTAYGSQVACSPSPGSGAAAVAVTASVSGLSAGTTYHFRLVATNRGGSGNGADATFATAAPPPSVVTGAASSVTATGATLGGTVNPNGANVSACTIEYGTTASYGASVPCAALPGGGSSPVAVSGSVSGLATGTTYHYRVTAANGSGAGSGADATFTTSAVPRDGKVSLPRTARVKSGVATLVIACKGDAGATCKGSMTLKAKVKAKKKGRRAKTKTITVGNGSYDLAAGKTATLRIPLTSAAKAALKRGKIKATAAGVDGTVTLPKTKKAKHHKR